MAPKITTADAAQVLDVSVQAIHKKIKTNEFVHKKSQNRIYFEHETSTKLFGFKFKRQVVSIQIVKGGTGKTTLTHAIAVRANLYGARVLCIDLDQQGNLTQSFNINAADTPVMVDILEEGMSLSDGIVNVSSGLDIVPSRIDNATLDNTLMLKRINLQKVFTKLLEPVKKNYDLIIIDCPPNLGQSVSAATLASDLVIIPVTPEQFSITGLKLSFQEIANLKESFDIKNIKLKILLNKYDTRTSLSHEVLSSLIQNKKYHKNMFKTYIRISQEFPNVTVNRESIYESLKTTSAKEDVDLVTREILNLKTA
ncbi:AAA family ATPase [bacterium]|jgi:chromosome partitioning protein|nr:AAA family ATPase [bacterium]